MNNSIPGKSWFILELYTPHHNTSYADVTLQERQHFSPKVTDKIKCSSVIVEAISKQVTVENTLFEIVLNFNSDYVGRVYKMYNLEVTLRENIQQNSINAHKIVSSVEVIDTNEY